MSRAGTAAIVLWHDISSRSRDEFYAGHDRAHIPERVAIPGSPRPGASLSARGRQSGPTASGTRRRPRFRPLRAEIMNTIGAVPMPL